MNNGMSGNTQFSIYVIELNKEVLTKKKYQGQNPNYNPEKPCVYVGQTSLTPEGRFEKHKSGEKSAKIVKNFGVRLKPRLYKSHNPMKTREEAEKMEVEKARRLRKRGYWVWYN